MKQWYSSEQPFYPGMFTPDQKAGIMRTELFTLARAIHVMSNGSLLLTGTSGALGRGITMGTRSGMNALFLQHTPLEKKGRYRVTRYSDGDSDTHFSMVSSNNMNYILRKMKTDDDASYSFIRAMEHGNEQWYAGVLRRLMDRYMNKLAKTCDVDLSSEMQFESSVQEWMLRCVSGSCSVMDFPNHVRNKIDLAARAYQNKEKFLQRAQEHTAIMFDREKWLVCQLQHGFVIAGVDTRSSVKLIADAMMCGGKMSYSTNNHATPLYKFTYEPRLVKSLDNVEESIRSSLLSSLTMYKMGRDAAHGSLTGIDKDSYFVGLSGADDNLYLSNEGGWSTWRNSHYAHWVIVDKDQL